jgi:hypothetical protein
MNKRGRKPSFVVDEKVLQEVKKMSGIGLTQKQIANYYGISAVYWHRVKKRNKKLDIACKIGKSSAIAAVSGKLMKKINEGNLSATIFYLKTQAGWSEKNTLDIKNKVKSKNVEYKIDTMDAIEASKIYQSIMTGSYKDE